LFVFVKARQRSAGCALLTLLFTYLGSANTKIKLVIQ